MRGAKFSSSRLLFDLQACQTHGSGARGVGRYSHALFARLLQIAPQHEIHALVSTELPIPVDFSGLNESRILRVPPLPAWGAAREYKGGAQDTLDGLALSSLINSLKPDVVHVSHVFEGFGDRVALPAVDRRARGQLITATLYDLIPLLFQEHYFQNEDFRQWYFSRVAWLRKADHLLAISESSRSDAINLLGIESWRITTIHGGISPHFFPAADAKVNKRALSQKYKLRDKFVLYTGGDDHRKNIRGAIEGYAAIPSELRKDCQLVIVCAMEEHRKMLYLGYAKAAGLIESDVLITGFVTEIDLVAFYRACDVFVFPSLYEGLGLPVLEAMACGAPVLGGDNSSVREIIVRSDAMFDARSARSIGDAIGRVFTDKKFADELRRYGIQRAKNFSWDSTAAMARDAFEEAENRAREAGVQSAVSGWLPKRRLAVLSPLPPCRSGIADYTAKFLPFLARHFDIDLFTDSYKVSDEILTTSFRIFDVGIFASVATKYDVILYEFGNSEFHAHMLPLLEKFPGVVGLHDAYLSGLYGYLDFQLGDAGKYAFEMLAAHGPQARRCFAPAQGRPDANWDAMVSLPCTKRVLDQALGVISHSPFNLEIARECYPRGWLAPYRIIPQMVSIPPPWSAVQRCEAKRKLGFAPDDLIVTTFGHVAWTKWGDKLFEAFNHSPLAKNTNVHLVFAGELTKDEFGSKLTNAIQESGCAGRVHITGFLSENAFEMYLRVTDVAVQLRTKSRGGTPKGVLDCLAYGVPVIVNNDASYKDYPNDVVVKIAPEPSPPQLSKALVELCADEAGRKKLSYAALKYVADHHSPALCAAQYAAAMNEFAEREYLTRIETSLPLFGSHLASCANVSSAADLAIDWLREVPYPSFERQRVIVDVSHIAKSDHKTGIPRVVKKIIHALYCASATGYEPIAVELVDGVLRPATDWLDSQGLVLGRDVPMTRASHSITFMPGDVFLMLDSSWGRYREFFPIFDSARRGGASVVTAIYDLLPITLPVGNIVDGGKEWFTGWFEDAVASSDGLLCISHSVADDVKKHISNKLGAAKKPKIGYWHLGSDIKAATTTTTNTATTETLQNLQYLLMVGTIEPRKSHIVALASMEKCWSEGLDLCLCIVGKEGWMVSDLMTRLRNHPQLGKKLFVFEDASDDEIQFLYSKAKALLFISKGEGFGLPLVEAANFGTPIICSNIPVFREIAGNFATYVNHEDPIKLADEVKEWLKLCETGNLPDTRQMPRLTWEESAAALLDVVTNNNWLKE
jgi:glycosyltransferase involved in cell wall biosynthesis